ncbi:MAG: GTP cyclohydrolase I FolE [Candidatus Eisenbacteria bacterium]|nr:GTP cyclohydrolase I FolE [Candidatus Eisenbacteria bacterium]
MESIVRSFLTELGEDPEREGLKETPRRVAKAWKFLTEGYDLDPKVVLNNAIFSEDVDEMITIRNIEIYSMCEHHLLPFFGKAHVAYMPNGKIIGFSKIPRLVDIYARRLQVQERLTRQIADTIQELLNPRGVAVVIEAVHLCMTMRGVQKQNSVAVTSAMLGGFRDDRSSRMEFLELIRGQTNGVSA